MIELRPAPGAMGIVEPVNSATRGVVQGQAVLDPMRPRPGRLDRLRRDLDPIAAGELKLETIEAEEHLKLVILSHITSYQDLMLRDKKMGGCRRHTPRSCSDVAALAGCGV